MDQPAYHAPSASYKDRSTGLTIFGIMTLLLGGAVALLVPLMIVGQAMASQVPGATSNKVSLVPAILMYGGMAVVLIWLGVGSIMARRWARALLLIFSWSCLMTGIITFVTMAIMLPKMTDAMMSAAHAQQPPTIQVTGEDGVTRESEVTVPDVPAVIMVGLPLLFIGFFMVALPTGWVLFYRSPHVKATCEARDPVRRWTDACPLPVLAVSLWLVFSALMLLTMPLAAVGVLPFFGEFLTGAAGSAGFVFLAVVWAWCAWAIYRLKTPGWWVTMALFLIFMASHVLTYMRHDIMELYALMGHSQKELADIKPFTQGMEGLMTWGMAVFAVPVLGYMLYVKRFFPGGSAAAPSDS